MKKKVESFNKMVFLTDEGRFEVFNEEGGVWLDNDMWASNTYSFQDGYREPVYKTPAARELDRFLLAQNKSTKKTTRSADKVVVDSPFKGYVTRNERKGRIEASSKSNVIYDPRFKWNALG
jgi:hypothetical protein